MRNTMRLAALGIAAILMIGAWNAPASATDDELLPCKLKCAAATGACYAAVTDLDICAGFLAGCFYGCSL